MACTCPNRPGNLAPDYSIVFLPAWLAAECGDKAVRLSRMALVALQARRLHDEDRSQGAILGPRPLHWMMPHHHECERCSDSGHPVDVGAAFTLLQRLPCSFLIRLARSGVPSAFGWELDGSVCWVGAIQ